MVQHAGAQPFEEILNKMEASYATVNDYTCVLYKKELVRGNTIEQKNIIYKYRKPGSYYMKWTEEPEKGAEAIYVLGKYNNRLRIHSGNFFGFINMTIDPAGMLAMRNDRHSINESDLGHIINLLRSNYNQAKENSELLISAENDEIFEGRTTLVYKVMFPGNKGYYGHVIIINIDQEKCLPLHIMVYGWNMELWEEYSYARLTLNPGLTEDDFNDKNNAYGF